MNNKIAIIDCGTNTFHLFIIETLENDYRVIVRNKTLVKIGEGGINEKLINDAAMKRAIAALTEFKTIIDKHAVTKVFAFATSAFRNANNGRALKNRIKSQSDIDISIIEGDREAELIFYGVNAAMDIGAEPVLVMDIGGGSVEFIIGSKNNIFWKRSFEIGAQRLKDLFHNSDPIDTSDLNKLNQYLKDQLTELLIALKTYKPLTLIGSSGTFDTLSNIYCQSKGLPYHENDPETPIELKTINGIYNQLTSKNREERLQIPGMIAMRVDMIVVATGIIDFLLKNHTFNKMRVSTFALKEGILDRILKGSL